MKPIMLLTSLVNLASATVSQIFMVRFKNLTQFSAAPLATNYDIFKKSLHRLPLRIFGGTFRSDSAVCYVTLASLLRAEIPLWRPGNSLERRKQNKT
ncbi:hypothetical protein AMECASPLE_024482 [Ameca splendens]|uniref:Secreted protein n=1 Tax=Ameca splendens TaxID=208324 RepID=A0ABV1ACC5_9TELE